MVGEVEVVLDEGRTEDDVEVEGFVEVLVLVVVREELELTELLLLPLGREEEPETELTELEEAGQTVVASGEGSKYVSIPGDERNVAYSPRRQGKERTGTMRQWCRGAAVQGFGQRRQKQSR